MKDTSVIGFGFHPNSAAVALNHAAANGQSDARSRILLLIMQPPENLKNSLVMLRGNANAIVPNGKVPLVSAKLCGDVDARRFLAMVFEAVLDQVQHQPHQLRALTDHVAQEHDKTVVLDCRGMQLVPPRYQATIKNVAIQLIRNAVMHGVETPAARRGIGKPAHGTGMRCSDPAELKVADRPDAQPRPVGQFLLGQPG